MAKKYLQQGTQAVEEVEALVTSTGAADAGKIIALDTTGKLSISVLPDGVGADVIVAAASENLSAGNVVNLWNDAGTLKVRKADASGGVAKKAVGFVKSAVSSGSSATVYISGTVTGLSGLTVGANYYLSATPGGVTTTIPTTAGHIAQYVGIATSTTELSFKAGDPIVRV